MALPLSVRTVYDESRNPFRCFTLSRSFVFEMYLYVAVRSHSIEMRNKKTPEELSAQLDAVHP